MKTKNSLILGMLLTLTGCSYHKTVLVGSESSIVHRSGPMGFDVIASDEGIVLHEGDRLTTPGAFRPPVEINVLAKTDSTNIRLVYAADQLIFNWENDLKQLRVDGGPANGLHKAGAGSIPKDRFVAIKWLVSRTNQAIYVDNELRFEHRGDYSTINRAVSVFPGAGSTVTVKSLNVKRIQQ